MIAFWIIGTLTLGYLGYSLPFTDSPKHTGEEVIVLLDNGNHIDIAFSRESFFAHAPSVFQEYRDLFPHRPYVAVGWGDEVFMLYHGTIDTVTFRDLFEASFRSKNSAIRMSFVSENVLKRAEVIRLSKKDESTIIQHVAKAEPVLLKLDKENEEVYLRSPVTYSLLRTCNDWTASALRSINQPTPYFVTTSGSLIRYYQSQ